MANVLPKALRRRTPRRLAPREAAGLQCVLCPSTSASPRKFFRGAPLCRKCFQGQAIGKVVAAAGDAIAAFLARKDY